tara:strand:- start:219 stop:1442 length:1224 start_codon:yes stop_codon:yes gene_type:complete
MANFDAQIQDLVGTGFTDQTAMDTWMTEGAKELINLFKSSPELLLQCATESSLDHTATTLTNMDSRGIIMGVTRDNGTSQQPCREIPPLYRERATDINDMMFYATEDDPVYYTWNNILSVIPVPTASQAAKVQHITYPSINASDTDAISNFPDNAEYLVVLYAAKKALQQQLNSKNSDLPNDISAPVLASVGSSLPTYSAPSSFVLIPPPAGADVDLSSITFSFPTVPIVSPDFADIDNWINTEEDSEMAAARIQAVSQELAEYGADIQAYTAEVGKETQRFQAEIAKAIQKYQSETGYDLGLYNAQIQAQLQKFNSDLQENSTNFMNNLQKYQAEFGKVAADNQSILGKYAQDLANYNAKIQKHNVDYQWLQNQYAVIEADYQKGVQILIGSGKQSQPQPQQQGGQ